MKVIRGLRALKSLNVNSAVCTVGIFDGVHIGHREIIKKVVSEARRKGKTSLVLTFWPHPCRLTDKINPPPLLNSLKERLGLIGEISPDICLVMKFTKAVSRMTPRKFLKGILLEKLKMSQLIVGENFFFGRDAMGDARFLKKMAKEYNFRLVVVPLKKIQGAPVSSSYIRYLIDKGSLKEASELLGRPL